MLFLPKRLEKRKHRNALNTALKLRQKLPLEGPRRTFFSRMVERFRFGKLSAIGCFLILSGFLLEMNHDIIWSFYQFIKTGSPEPGKIQQLQLISISDLCIIFLKELGVAVIIAAIIGGSFERKAREADNDRAMRLREQVASDAVFTIFSVTHTREFVRAAVDTNLGAEIVREDAHLAYELRELTESEARLISEDSPLEALERFAILEMVSVYSLRNVSASPQRVQIRYDVDLRQGGGARSLSKAHHVCLDDEVVPPDQIEDFAVPSDDDGIRRYEWPRWLSPGASIKIIFGVRCVKERSDNEVWESFFPTMGNMTLSLAVMNGMSFGVRALSNSRVCQELTVPTDWAGTWRIDGPLLRHDSVIFWWRTPEDEATGKRSEPHEFSSADVLERYEREFERRGLTPSPVEPTHS